VARVLSFIQRLKTTLTRYLFFTFSTIRYPSTRPNMSLYCFLISLLLGWAVLPGAESRPSAAAAVELSTCGASDSVDALAVHCASVCQPVREAQTCALGAACTCSIAPPAAVQACLQCHVDANQEVYDHEIVLLIPSRLDAYSEICGVPPIVQLIETEDSIDIVRNTSLDRREVSGTHCIYGLPQVVEFSALAFIKGQKKFWPLYFLILLMVLSLFKARS